MGQKLMVHEVSSRDARISMDPDESVLILIQHCKDMKKQEMCLRFITLLVLLSCVTLFIFTIGADLRQHENSGYSGQGSAVEQSPAYSKQGSVCPADNPKTNDSKRLRIRLRAVLTDNNTDGQHIKWEVLFGDKYNAEKCAIVIPETGEYFVYVRIALNCQTESGYEKFYVKLLRWSESYDKTVLLAKALDGIACTSGESTSVFVGEVFDLLAGDHVSVWIEEGYKLIMESSFGAYLT